MIYDYLNNGSSPSLSLTSSFYDDHLNQFSNSVPGAVTCITAILDAMLEVVIFYLLGFPPSSESSLNRFSNSVPGAVACITAISDAMVEVVVFISLNF